jgi:Tfp pilus assembly protein PilN
MPDEPARTGCFGARAAELRDRIMIKINLLPKTIGLKRLMLVTMIAYGISIVAVAAALVAWNFMVLVPRAVSEEELATATETQQKALQSEVDKLRSETDATISAMVPLKQRLDFIDAILVYNTQYPKVFERVIKWTYDRVELSSMSCGGNTITMNARTKSLEDLGRYMLNIYRATKVFSSVAIGGFSVPGYPGRGAAGGPGVAGARMGAGVGMRQRLGMPGGLSGQGGATANSADANWINFTVTGTLIEPLPPRPTFGATAASPAVGAMAGGYGGASARPGMPAGIGVPGATARPAMPASGSTPGPSGGQR